MARTNRILNALTLGRKACGLMLLVAACSSTALAIDVPTTPEIDPGMATGAIAAAACGLMMMTDKIRRK